MNLLELAKKRFDDLSDNEVKLFEAVQKDGDADFWEDARTWATLTPTKDALPELRAECLAWLLTDKRAVNKVTHRGVTICGARLVGKMDASFARFPWQFRLAKCHVSEEIILQDASFGLLNFMGSVLDGGLNADRMHVSGSVFLRNGFKALGGVRLLGADIGGNFECVDSILCNPGGYALNADGIHVAGDVMFKDGFLSEGVLRLLGATIGGDLMCVSSMFKNPNNDALSADRMTISGGVFFHDGCIAEGAVRLLAADIGGSLSCGNSTLCNPNGKALNSDGMQVAGSVFLDKEFKATGEVRLLGVDIGRNLECGKGTFNNQGGNALNCDGMKVSGSVFFHHGFKATGEVRLLGSDIGGALNCRNGTFYNPKGDALSADQMKVAGGVFLNGGFNAVGKVRLLGVNIGGDLSCGKGTFNSPGTGALSADGMRVAGDVFWGAGFLAEGAVRLLGANVGGDFNCRGGLFHNPEATALNADRIKVTGSVFFYNDFEAVGEVRLLGAEVGGSVSCTNSTFFNPNGDALSFDGVHVVGDVFFNDGFKADGGVRLPGSTVGGAVVCVRSKFHNAKGYAFNADGCEIKGHLFFSGVNVAGRVELIKTVIHGSLKIQANTWGTKDSLILHGASAEEINDHDPGQLRMSGWPHKGNLRLNGFTYQRISDPASKSVSDRLAWLDLQPDDDYRPQPYEQLASILEKAGHENRARAVRIAKNDKLMWFIRHREPSKLGHHYYKEFLKAEGDERFDLAGKMLPDRLERQAAGFPKCSCPRRLWHWFLGWSVGYGYKQARLLLWMLAFIVLGSVLFKYGFDHGGMTASQKNLFTAEVRESGVPGQPQWRTSLGDNDVRQLMPEDYPHFHPVIYSLDTFLPLVDLEQESFWMPNSNFEKSVSCLDWNVLKVTGFRLRVYLTIHILMGWFLTSMAIAAFTGRLKR
jgi:hypothetical protein